LPFSENHAINLGIQGSRNALPSSEAKLETAAPSSPRSEVPVSSPPVRIAIDGNKKEDGMSKKIAVVVRERQGEALRMGVGLTLADDSVDVFVLDRKVEETEENALNIETMDMMDIKLYTNVEGAEGMEYISTEDMAAKLLEYDNIIPY
jgi:hypothetical protein